jgi:hypothetical protein
MSRRARNSAALDSRQFRSVQNRQHPALFRAMEQRFRLHIFRCASLDQAIRGRSGISISQAIFTRRAAGHIASGLLRFSVAGCANGSCLPQCERFESYRKSSCV